MEIRLVQTFSNDNFGPSWYAKIGKVFQRYNLYLWLSTTVFPIVETHLTTLFPRRKTKLSWKVEKHTIFMMDIMSVVNTQRRDFTRWFLKTDVESPSCKRIIVVMASPLPPGREFIQNNVIWRVRSPRHIWDIVSILYKYALLYGSQVVHVRLLAL